MDKFFAKQLKQPNPHAADPPPPADAAPTTDDAEPRKPPRGVVLGEDGKPCRSCTSAFEWKKLMRSATAPSATPPSSPTAASSPSSPPSDCPPDVDRLGRHTWTLLHSISAAYPARASRAQQADMAQFLALFAALYPCGVCADDFRGWMRREGNAPRVEGREGLGAWMCEAHNAVNRKLGKREFDCARWEERWRTGWREGGCD
ncbi:hypothetical protein MMC13_000308 [Lambiella insularis]|nr:hypothetical protein [Lambiella insularis]